MILIAQVTYVIVGLDAFLRSQSPQSGQPLARATLRYAWVGNGRYDIRKAVGFMCSSRW
jgi:hypothetical protein